MALQRRHVPVGHPPACHLDWAPRRSRCPPRRTDGCYKCGCRRDIVVSGTVSKHGLITLGLREKMLCPNDAVNHSRRRVSNRAGWKSLWLGLWLTLEAFGLALADVRGRVEVQRLEQPVHRLKSQRSSANLTFKCTMTWPR